MSFLEIVKTSRSDLLYIVRGKRDNWPFWHYILVDKFRLPMFLVKSKSNLIDLNQYGEIIESGWGENPPEEISKKINERYS